MTFRNPGEEKSHFIHGRGRLGATIANGLGKLGVSVVDDLGQADIIWFCVPEKVLKSEAEKIAAGMDTEIRFVHTSGLLTAEAVRVRPDIQVASLHPAYSFPNALSGMPENILWTFEGDAGMRHLLSPLVSAWKGKWVEIAANAKIPYHIACVLMGNLVDVPVAAAEEICREFELPFSEMTASLLLPHIEAVKAGRVFEKTTGPASRGDFETVERETEWLHRNFPGQEQVYAILSAFIQKKNT
ncbi:MAG: DUF2520 domain-containing protein [Acidobacteria bacterium]|nr:DUF2520 domain-containing protein [Acidobacteriota bacterium]